MLVVEYREARSQEHLARLRRLWALRALATTGSSQLEIAAALSVLRPQRAFTPDESAI